MSVKKDMRFGSFRHQLIACFLMPYIKAHDFNSNERRKIRGLISINLRRKVFHSLTKTYLASNARRYPLVLFNQPPPKRGPIKSLSGQHP